jgi:hypothetical protein
VVGVVLHVYYVEAHLRQALQPDSLVVAFAFGVLHVQGEVPADETSHGRGRVRSINTRHTRHRKREREREAAVGGVGYQPWERAPALR